MAASAWQPDWDSVSTCNAALHLGHESNIVIGPPFASLWRHPAQSATNSTPHGRKMEASRLRGNPKFDEDPPSNAFRFEKLWVRLGLPTEIRTAQFLRPLSATGMAPRKRYSRVRPQHHRENTRQPYRSLQELPRALISSQHVSSTRLSVLGMRLLKRSHSLDAPKEGPHHLTGNIHISVTGRRVEQHPVSRNDTTPHYLSYLRNGISRKTGHRRPTAYEYSPARNSTQP